MDKNKEKEIHEKLILLTIEDVAYLTGWSKEVVRKMFAYDEDFPAIKKGKQYQVELGALKMYLNCRRINKK